jgi:hypothetical protein
LAGKKVLDAGSVMPENSGLSGGHATVAKRALGSAVAVGPDESERVTRVVMGRPVLARKAMFRK